MNQSQPKNPLHGITLKSILEYLVAEYGWEQLGDRINIRCFTSEPSINSSLKFLRKTDWARAKVERLYLCSISYDARHGKKTQMPMKDKVKRGVSGTEHARINEASPGPLPPSQRSVVWLSDQSKLHGTIGWQSFSNLSRSCSS